ncbi:NAD-dependent epimerase/dehydratase family protein [Nocardia flavorosea]|uniref:NAD-dependent epimerase/dehydratase family protein n=1 Tax=Nocardia flavorosea TaxID=53429 RepID=A0A846YDN3_9NOCA|nr:NAD-dependent epimerase/dehydratase family protein [Nocardia flavorosea]NKY55951.1 NAD-dependent epimerase/dehydratase family protein [Nocardia flavorosea]
MNHVVVTGGAGFLGSHLCRALLDRGDRVTAIDNLSTGRIAAVADLTDRPRFALRIADTADIGTFADLGTVTHIAHLAGPGSPAAAARASAATLRAAVTGTLAALDVAAAHHARIVLVTGCSPHRIAPAGIGESETPSVHEAANLLIETATRNYRDTHTAIVRPFEVYGPQLRPGDGRITAHLCAAALRDQTIHLTDPGTRAFVYIADAIECLSAILDSDIPGPIDIAGPPASIADFGRTACELAGRGWVEFAPARTATATRPPNLTRTRAQLGWFPTTALHTGIHHTLGWMRATLLTCR